MPWVETPTRRKPQLRGEKKKSIEQRRRWFSLCLDHELMYFACVGALRLVNRAIIPSAFPYARRLLWRWSRNEKLEFDHLTDKDMLGCLYGTLVLVASGQARIVGVGVNQRVTQRSNYVA